MKRLFEFKVFDLMKDKETETFLRKVKEENPDEYGHFVTLVGNKGLEVAKDRYKEYDPNYWKEQRKKEKEDALRRKKENTKEEKEKREQEILKESEPEIKRVNNILMNTALDDFLMFINKNKNIREFLNSYKARKTYKNAFAEMLKKPLVLRSLLRWDFTIDTLSFNRKEYAYYDYDDKPRFKKMIDISQHFNLETGKISYAIYFSPPDPMSNISKQDSIKRPEFIRDRNDFIYNLRKVGIEKYQVIEQLQKLSRALSEDLYSEWYKKWELEQDMKKYNL